MASEDSKYVRAIEADAYDWPAWGGFDNQFYDSFYPYTNLTPPFMDHQKRGEALPFYLNEQQLKLIRDRSRRLVSENEFAICAIENRISFLIGSGLNYRVLPAHKGTTDKILEEAQVVVDTFCEVNELWKLEQEAVLRNDRDGESFMRLFYMPSGVIKLRWVEPEHVRCPNGDTQPQKSFGIETDPRDIYNVRGYWVVRQPLMSWSPDFIPAREMVHFKCNTDSSAKRGMPVFYSVETNLRHAEEILAAMSATAKARAKIALIRRVDGVNKTAAQKMKTDLETGSQFDPTTGGVTNVEQLKNSSILTSSKNIEYEFPSNQGDVTGTVAVLQAELRAAAARLVMPEYMLSADASNGTYNSQGLTDSPVTRNFQRLQTQYRHWFGESKTPGREALIWRQIKYAVEMGILHEDTLSCVKVVAQPPDIISRNPDTAASANRTYFDMGVKSPQAIAGELGYDWVQIQEERKAAGLPPVNPMAAGMTSPVAPPPTDAPQGGQSGDDDGEYEMDASLFEGL
jgi:hypothetical protein